MKITVRKLTTKTQALVAASSLLYPERNITFAQIENSIIETLTDGDNVISGWTAIFAFLSGISIDSPLFSDFYFITSQLKNGKSPISQEALEKLNSILATKKTFSGDSPKEIDIIAYTRVRNQANVPESLKHLSHLHEWFLQIQAWAEKSVAEAFNSVQVLASKKKGNKPAGEQKVEEKKEKKLEGEINPTEKKPKGDASKPKGDAPKQAKKKEEKKEEAPKPVFAAKADTVDPAYREKINSQKIVRSNEGKPVLPVNGERNVLITSALPYVNNAPHLGTLIGCVLSADVFARYCRLRGYNTLYVCGTDEYGTATEMKALQEGLTPKEICDKYYKIQSDVYKWFQIDFDIFGRTTTEKHTKISQDIFLTLHKNGYITEDTMSQSYCANCDKFLADRYVKGICPFCNAEGCYGDQCDKCSKLVNPAELINAQCSICSHPSEIKETKHFFLDLPQLESEIEAFIEKQSKEGDWSDNAYKTSKAWIKTGLKKRCITRDLKWGTPLPIGGWENKVMYVWFDAPIGYPSITANLVDDWQAWWKNPENVKLYQFIGKDNIPFHCVIFPGTLLGTRENWTFLHSMSSTEYLMYEGDKFSKSKGTGVFGDQTEKTGIPLEVWRYFLLINRPEQSDADFKWADFAAKNNNELLPNVGNLVQRILKFLYTKFDKKVPALDLAALSDEDKTWLQSIWKLFQDYLAHLEKVELKSSLKIVMQISSECNFYMTKNEPWNKANQESGRHIVSLVVLANLIRFLSALFEPYLPSLSAKINYILGQEVRTPFDEQILKHLTSSESSYLSLLSLIKPGQVINEPIPLFRKLEDSEIDQFRIDFGGHK